MIIIEWIVYTIYKFRLLFSDKSYRPERFALASCCLIILLNAMVLIQMINKYYKSSLNLLILSFPVLFTIFLFSKYDDIESFKLKLETFEKKNPSRKKGQMIVSIYVFVSLYLFWIYFRR